jgi:RNA polymerase sigma-70 factor (ECF subfamily)
VSKPEKTSDQIDKEFVARVQQGDKSAFDHLVRKYQHKIIQLVNRYVKDPSEAQDVTQEAFIKAYRGLKNFRGDSAFYTWMYRIAINTAKNHLVSQSRRLPANDIDAQEAEQYGGESALKEYASPEHESLRDEMRMTIIRAINKLPTDLRTAITLREIEGMSYEEIAVAMECPIGTVRSRIFRARESVDKELKPLL